MAKYDWKIENRDEDWSDDTYAYFLIHINLKKMVEYLTKEFKKDWWFKAHYGQDNCYIVAENNNFPVRLFFIFDEGGWADITRHYTDGATFIDDHLGSWHFGKYDVDYSYAMIRENIKEYFNKFEESMKKRKKSLKEKLNDNGDVKFNDIYSCDLVNVLTVTVYDRELYEKLREEDLVLYQKGLYEQIDWKSFQDEISYLRDDIYASDDFDVKFTLLNGILIIDILDDTDKDVIMEYRLESKFVN